MRVINGPIAVRAALARSTRTRRRVSRALVLVVAALCGSLLTAGVANASPQSVTFLGANPGNGYSINQGPYSFCIENGSGSNYCPSLTVQDATAEWFNPVTQAWQPAYDVGIHPWGEVTGTNSWINCGPSLFDCVNQTSTYRVRFTVPSDWSNPSMTLTARADNVLTVKLNGQTLISNAVGGNGFETSTTVPSLSAGVNELDFIVTDQGGITGFNYRADLTYDASSGSSVIGAGDPTPTTGCAPGTYSATGATPCVSAPAGSYVPGSWATSATPCPAGTYSSAAGSSSCTAAPAGSYAASGATSATPCPAGTYSSDAGSSSCTAAPAGSYVSGTGATSATPCPGGTYSSSAGSSSCTTAPAGSYAASGATSATPCPAGTYSSDAGSSSCTAAPAGSYVSGTGATSATPCPAGTYSSSAGSASCTPAPAGSYVSGAGATSATPCPGGTYSSSAGSSSCTLAPAGFYAASGSTSATPCPAGTYSASAGSSSCTPAPVDTYVSTTGATAATPCPVDTWTNGKAGQTACVPIPPTITLKSISPAANTNGWHNGPVTVTWACTHSTSPTVSVTLSDDGANQSATGTCVSSVDSSLTASDKQVGISIDQTKPTLSPTVSPSPAALGGTVTASANASDALSGIDSASCGATPTSSLGTHTVTCTATDKAGNSASATVSYDVTAVATKQAVLAGIQAALASASPHDANMLGEAAKKLSDALTPSYWTNANHPSSKSVFEDEKEAVQKLGELLKDKSSQISGATLQGWIGSLTGLDRAMAALAVHDAAAGDAHQLAEAAKELANGDAEAAKGHLDAAIEHYGNAWQKAQER